MSRFVERAAYDAVCRESATRRKERDAARAEVEHLRGALDTCMDKIEDGGCAGEGDYSAQGLGPGGDDDCPFCVAYNTARAALGEEGIVSALRDGVKPLALGGEVPNE